MPLNYTKEFYLRIILSIILAVTVNFASSLQEDVWWKGETLLTFFEKHGISKDIYFNLPSTDKELSSEIYAGVLYQKMIDEKGNLEQALIPISEEMQLHIFKDSENKFTLDIIPIEFQEVTESITS